MHNKTNFNATRFLELLTKKTYYFSVDFGFCRVSKPAVKYHGYCNLHSSMAKPSSGRILCIPIAEVECYLAFPQLWNSICDNGCTPDFE